MKFRFSHKAKSISSITIKLGMVMVPVNPLKPIGQNLLNGGNFTDCEWVWYYKLKHALGCGKVW